MISKKSQESGQQNKIVQFEHEVLEFWEKEKCFEKSVESRPADKPYTFYDGPPFATGLPHYGHIVASLMKDMVPRFWTMRGYRVERVWGWDCHGLPMENIIEKELGIEGRKQIEEYGVDKFCQKCRDTVLRYAHDWQKTVARLGRWVDMEHAYRTMDRDYIESVWWVFKELWKKGLIYEGHKAMHICPRCVTPLSNFEVTLGYKDVQDLSVVVKFALPKAAQKFGLSNAAGDASVFALAWTTTPWTLPGNALLAVGGNIQYVLVRSDDAGDVKAHDYYVLAKERVPKIFKENKFEVVRELAAAELVDLIYEPLFPYFSRTANAFRIVAADFVSTAEGTGIVHIAPAFGEDDYELGQREKVPLLQHVKMDGQLTPEVVDFVGQEVKPKEDPTATDKKIVVWLTARDKLFHQEFVSHSYPHCWRCDTPLLNYATTSWFVKVTALKEQLLANNQKIHWVPEHIKDGRFGKWLESSRDWAISRSRYWGAPLPVWQAKDGETICVGSVAELVELTGGEVADLHKPCIDDVVIKRAGKEFYRVPEVLDCWFESGSMPYGQYHYPFANREKFERGFPAQFIAEGQDQTRGWFYTLHVLATALTSERCSALPSTATEESAPGASAPGASSETVSAEKSRSIPVVNSSSAFENVVVNGIVLAADGKKMSKRLQNYPDPLEVLERYGADALRYYLATSPVMEGENLNFLEKDVDEVYKKFINTLWNVTTFYLMFAPKLDEVEGSTILEQVAPERAASMQPVTAPSELTNMLDKWIMAKLQQMALQVTQNYEKYILRQAAMPLMDFVQELSTWYVRRSRQRFKGDDVADKAAAQRTLYTVLVALCKIAAPVTPFITEKIYQSMRREGDPISVHLCDWPQARKEFFDEKILEQMRQVRAVIEQALALRATAGIKVRQPLASVTVAMGAGEELDEAWQQIIKDELNVKEVKFGRELALDTKLTDELRLEGLLRELIRQINALRKKAGLTINDLIELKIHTTNAELREAIANGQSVLQKSILAKSVTLVDAPQEKELVINSQKLTLSFSF